MEFDPKRYEPVHHNVASRAGHALGEGAQRGFWSGLKSGGVAALIAPVALGGLLAYNALGAGMWTAIGMGAAGVLVGGVASALAMPLIAGVAVIGTGVGLLRGARDGKERTGKEQMAARYVDGYEAQMTAMQGELAQAAQRQAAMEEMMIRQAAQAQHKPSHHERAEAAHHGGHHTQDRPGDKYAHASTHNEAAPQLDAATIAHEGLAKGPELAAAR